MAVTIVVLSGREPSRAGGSEQSGYEHGGSEPRPHADLSLTLDAPRIVIGRGEGCDVRLPDPSVSHRHASIRQRGGEYVVLDENSQNGTFLDRVRLPPQTPRAVRSGERMRVGRVWLELRLEPAMVKGSTAAAAKELALALVARGLAMQGEEPGPRVAVLDGPSAGASLVLADPTRSYVIGRLSGADLRIDDDLCARQHARISRRGDTLSVQDCGSPAGTTLDGERLGPREVAWRLGQTLEIAGARLTFDYPAADALAELERSPDERMPDGEAPEPPAALPSPAEPATDAPAPEATPTPPPASALDRASNPRRPAEPGGWNAVDSAVVFVAIGVLAVSLIGAFWLLGR